jgi:hypothetical protein
VCRSTAWATWWSRDRRRPRRNGVLLKVLLVLAILIGGLLVAADVGSRAVAESQLRERVEAAARPGGGASARIRSFPFLGRLLASGSVSRMEVSVADVTVEDVTFARLAVDLRKVVFDRDKLLSERTVELRSIGRGTGVAEVDQAELSRLVGAPVVLEAGRARVRVVGQLVTATATVRDNTLRISVSGLSVPPLRIPRLPLVPCVANIEILPGRLRLTCDLDRVPVELLRRPVAARI